MTSNLSEIEIYQFETFKFIQLVGEYQTQISSE